jgi:hypothetical protein
MPHPYGRPYRDTANQTARKECREQCYTTEERIGAKNADKSGTCEHGRRQKTTGKECEGVPYVELLIMKSQPKERIKVIRDNASSQPG